MDLVLPNNYVALEQEEMMYLEGEGWIADAFAVGNSVAGTIFYALLGAAAGGAASSYIPFIGTFTGAAIGGISGAILGYKLGRITGYHFGRIIETRLLGWR